MTQLTILLSVDVEANRFRFFVVELRAREDGSAELHRRWGRIGTDGRRGVEHFSTVRLAESAGALVHFGDRGERLPEHCHAEAVLGAGAQIEREGGRIGGQGAAAVRIAPLIEALPLLAVLLTRGRRTHVGRVPARRLDQPERHEPARGARHDERGAPAVLVIILEPGTRSTAAPFPTRPALARVRLSIDSDRVGAPLRLPSRSGDDSRPHAPITSRLAGVVPDLRRLVAQSRRPGLTLPTPRPLDALLGEPPVPPVETVWRASLQFRKLQLVARPPTSASGCRANGAARQP